MRICPFAALGWLAVLMTAWAPAPAVAQQRLQISSTIEPQAGGFTAGDTIRVRLRITCASGAETVELSLRGTPPRTDASFDPNPVDTPGRTILILETSNRTPARTYTLTVVGTPQRGNCRPGTINLLLELDPPVELSVSPKSQNVIAGGTTAYTIELARKNFDGPVTLTAAGLPRGVTAKFEPDPATAARSTLTLTAAVDARVVKDRSFQIQGTAEVEVASTSARVTVQPPPSTVSLIPPPAMVTVRSGEELRFKLGVQKVQYQGQVAVDRSALAIPQSSASVEPDGFTDAPEITAVIKTTRFTGPGSSGTPPGKYHLSIPPLIPDRPENANVQRLAAEVDVIVTAGPEVFLSASPATQVVEAGGAPAVYNLMITKVGFNGDVSFGGVIGLPEDEGSAAPDRPVNPARVIVSTRSTTSQRTFGLTFQVTFLLDGVNVIVPSNEVALVVGMPAAGPVVLSAPALLQTRNVGEDIGYLIEIARNGYDGRLELRSEVSPSGPNPAPPAGVVNVRFDSPIVEGTDDNVVFRVFGLQAGGPFTLQIHATPLDAIGIPVQPTRVNFQFRVPPPPPPNPPANLTVSPASLSFIGTQGGPNPPGKTIAVGSTGSALNWTASDNAPWLSFAPASGTTPAAATVSVNLAGLAAGTLNAVITLSASGSPAVTVPVSLQVDPQQPAPPKITSFTPASGPAGTPVTINGSNFDAEGAVRFNGVAAGFSSPSPTLIQATVPAGAATGPITVITGTGTATSATSFVVTTPAPTIVSFSPAGGRPGDQVTINGSNFNGVTSVAFNGANAQFFVTSPTQLRANVPLGATTGPIRLTSQGGTAVSASSFAVTAGTQPTLTSFFPTSGPAGTLVTINGTNFDAEGAVRFNGIGANFSSPSSTVIQATVPAGATTGPITVITGTGTVTSATNFTVTTQPRAAAPTGTPSAPSRPRSPRRSPRR